MKQKDYSYADPETAEKRRVRVIRDAQGGVQAVHVMLRPKTAEKADLDALEPLPDGLVDT